MFIVMLVKQIVLIVHNVRSAHNVGSLLRTADGLGVETVYLTGYTPYPKLAGDLRLAHQANSAHNKIAKTALGAENKSFVKHSEDVVAVIENLKDQAFEVCALEQSDKSIKLPDYEASDKVALLVGREVEGIEPEVLAKTDKILQIPMFGDKESFNVCQAGAMGLYHLRFA